MKSVLTTTEPTNLSQAAGSEAVIAIAISQLSDRLTTVICLPAWTAPEHVLSILLHCIPARSDVIATARYTLQIDGNDG